MGSPDSLREWALMEAGTFHSVIQSNFMRSYRASRGRKRALEELPESVRGMIGELAAQKTLPPEQRRDENASGE